jgi:hypothetical protein
MRFCIPMPVLICAVGFLAQGCAPSTQDVERRPFFQQQYDTASHGRKTWFDHLVEFDPGGFDVTVAKDYQSDPPERIAVLPFSDDGSANLVVNKVPLTFRNARERANWAWTDSQRIRQALDGYLAQREFVTDNLYAVDAVLREHGITDSRKLDGVDPRTFGRWLGVDAVVYGSVKHYEAYYLFLVSGWEVGVEMRVVSTHSGRTLVAASGSRFDVSVLPALSLQDIAINSAENLLQLRDINLARSEEETCREIVKRIPRSKLLENRIEEQSLSYESDSARAQLADPSNSTADPPMPNAARP